MVEVNERHYNKTSGATVINEEHIWSGTVMNSPLLKRWVLFYIRGELIMLKKEIAEGVYASLTGR